MASIALGVTGGIGAYKAVEVARGLQKRGHDVTAIMTRSARRFVGPATFEAITRRRVITSQWTPGLNADIEHIALATGIDLLLVAPATANTIGKFAHGIADDFLSSLYLATRAPVLMAPAMNTHMFEHPAVVENLARLGARRHVRRPGRGLPGVRLDREGPARRARRDRGCRRAPAATGAGRVGGPPRARDGRADLRGSRPGALRGQPVERPHGLCRGGRGRAARAPW
jgi:phosphopantothenoylcysteine decarboxylase / phosphopantothenate---cysteine ligase